MRSAKRSDSLLLALFAAGSVAVFLANGCVGDPGGPPGDPAPGETQPGPSPTPSETVPAPGPEGNNILPVSVNGAACGPPGSQYANEPCVSVTICEPGTSNCQTIDRILLDTGSYGLRVYSSLLTVALTPVDAGSGALAECVQFGDGSSEWGPVESADVVLATESPVRVPVMLIDSTYATPPAPCSTAQSRPDTGPAQTGFNGILGVGLWNADCGSACATDASNGQYYSCTTSGCVPSKASEAVQVQNPVAHLSRDGNGVLLRLPAVPADGAPSIDGQLILGINTQADNTPGSVAVYGADSANNFATTFAAYSASVALPSFIDSGSSVLFFPPPADKSTLPDCDSSAGGSHGTAYKGFYCPSSTTALSAVNLSASQTSTIGTVDFSVANAYDLFASGNRVFGNMGDSSAVGSGAVFDWGLPFFYGRDVYVGIEGKSATIGGKSYAGPFWAY